MIGGLWSAGCDGYCLASLCSNSLRKVVAARWLPQGGCCAFALRFCQCTQTKPPGRCSVDRYRSVLKVACFNVRRRRVEGGNGV